MSASEAEARRLTLDSLEDGVLPGPAPPERRRPCGLPPCLLPLLLVGSAFVAASRGHHLAAPERVITPFSDSLSSAVIGKAEAPGGAQRASGAPTFGPRRSLERRSRRSRKVSGLLGLAEEHRDPCELPASDFEYWDELSAAEQSAAGDLGWSKASWNSDSERTTPATGFMTWSELSEKQTAAAKALGWSAKTWAFPGSEAKEWDELSGNEQKGAGLLGYGRDTWSSEDESEVPEAESKSWADLTYNEKDGARRLGWNEDTWDSC